MNARTLGGRGWGGERNPAGVLVAIHSLFDAPLQGCEEISNCFFAMFERTRVPGTFYRSLTVCEEILNCFFAMFERTRVPGTFYRSLTVTAP